MKVVLFTREADIDGISCATLAKLVFGEDCEVVLSSQEKINDDFIKFFDIESRYDDDEEIDSYDITGNPKIKEYDKIFMTDLCITGELLRKFFRAANVNMRMRIIDHHDEAFKNGVCNYGLCNDIKKKDEYGPCCSLGLFYAHLKQKQFFEPNRPTKEFVEMVRICDTNDLEKSTKKTEDLQLLFNAVSQEEFAFRVFDKISDNELELFDFTSEEKDIITIQRDRGTALKQTYEEEKE